MIKDWEYYGDIYPTFLRDLGKYIKQCAELFIKYNKTLERLHRKEQEIYDIPNQVLDNLNIKLAKDLDILPKEKVRLAFRYIITTSSKYTKEATRYYVIDAYGNLYKTRSQYLIYKLEEEQRCLRKYRETNDTIYGIKF
jgi:hypothetical protein